MKPNQFCNAPGSITTLINDTQQKIKNFRKKRFQHSCPHYLPFEKIFYDLKNSFCLCVYYFSWFVSLNRYIWKQLKVGLISSPNLKTTLNAS